MKNLMWQMGDRYGVVYLEDRKLLQVLLAMERFPARHEAETATYTNARGKTFAWQASFEMSLWNRVVRALGRESVEIQREAAPRSPRAGRGSGRVASSTPARSHTTAVAAPPSRAGKKAAVPAKVAVSPAGEKAGAATKSASAGVKKNTVSVPGTAAEAKRRPAASAAGDAAKGAAEMPAKARSRALAAPSTTELPAAPARRGGSHAATSAKAQVVAPAVKSSVKSAGAPAATTAAAGRKVPRAAASVLESGAGFPAGPDAVRKEERQAGMPVPLSRTDTAAPRVSAPAAAKGARDTGPAGKAKVAPASRQHVVAPAVENAARPKAPGRAPRREVSQPALPLEGISVTAPVKAVRGSSGKAGVQARETKAVSARAEGGQQRGAAPDRKREVATTAPSGGRSRSGKEALPAREAAVVAASTEKKRTEQRRPTAAAPEPVSATKRGAPGTAPASSPVVKSKVSGASAAAAVPTEAAIAAPKQTVARSPRAAGRTPPPAITERPAEKTKRSPSATAPEAVTPNQEAWQAGDKKRAPTRGKTQPPPPVTPAVSTANGKRAVPRKLQPAPRRAPRAASRS